MNQKARITVAYECRGKRLSRTVTAQIVHPLAFHPTIGEPGFWTVTHLASGRAVHRFIVCAKHAHEIAVKLAGLDGWGANAEQIVSNAALKQMVRQTLRQYKIDVK